MQYQYFYLSFVFFRFALTKPASMGWRNVGISLKIPPVEQINIYFNSTFCEIFLQIFLWRKYMLALCKAIKGWRFRLNCEKNQRKQHAQTFTKARKNSTATKF